MFFFLMSTGCLRNPCSVLSYNWTVNYCSLLISLSISRVIFFTIIFSDILVTFTRELNAIEILFLKHQHAFLRTIIVCVIAYITSVYIILHYLSKGSNCSKFFYSFTLNLGQIMTKTQQTDKKRQSITSLSWRLSHVNQWKLIIPAILGF